MKIIGGYDYYDRGMMHGVDTTNVFIRDNREIEGHFLSAPLLDLPYDGRGFYHDTVIIVIGDKLYSGVEFSTSTMFSREKKYFWSAESYLENIERHKIPNNTFSRWRKSVTPEEYFALKKTPEHSLSFMIDNGISILVRTRKPNRYNEWILHANPANLREYEFYKAVDAFTLYQAIDMWTSGVLAGSGNKMVEIKDDKIKIHKHGFDVKQSFRHRKAQ